MYMYIYRRFEFHLFQILFIDNLLSQNYITLDTNKNNGNKSVEFKIINTIV